MHHFKFRPSRALIGLLLFLFMLSTAQGQFGTGGGHKKKKKHKSVATPAADENTFLPSIEPVTSATLKALERAQSATYKPGDLYGPYVGRKFFRGPASVKMIVLSFDDGPSPQLTPKVVEILKREKIPATFFLIGQEVEHYPDTAKMVADAGFEIGCHSYTHPNMRRMDEAQVFEEIENANSEIEKVTGKRPRLFRPPFGTITAAVRNASLKANMVMVHWLVDPRDWNVRATPDMVYEQTMRQAVGGGLIVDMHDIHARTVEALPRIIAGLRAKGYEFTTVSGMMAEAEKHHADVAAQGEQAETLGTVNAIGEDTPVSALPKAAAIPLSDSAPK